MLNLKVIRNKFNNKKFMKNKLLTKNNKEIRTH